MDMELDNVEFYEIRPPWNTLIRVKPVDGTLIPSPAGNGNRSTAADFFDRPPALKLVEERDLNYVINVSDSEDEHSDQPGFEVGSIREDGTKASVPPAAKEEATRISRKRLLELEKKLLEQKRQAALNLLNLETQRRQRSVAVVALGTRPSPISASAPIVQARRPGVGTDASAVSVTATGAGSAASTSIPSMGLDRSRLLSELQAAERRVYEAKELLDALRKQLAECEENVRQQQALRDEVAEQIMMSEQQNALVPGGPVDSIEHQRTDDLTAMEVDGAAPITTNKASETGVLGPSSVVLPEFDAVLADESITQKDRVMESPSAVERWTPKAEAQTTYSAPALLDLQAFEAIGLRSLFERPDRVETLSGPGVGSPWLAPDRSN